MFEATCDKCGSRCEVPFRPNGEKPVYCRACFGKSDSGSAGRGPDQYRIQFDILNAKLDKIIKALIPNQTQEKAIEEKPVKEVVVARPKITAPPEPTIAEKPAEAAAEAKTKKAAGKKPSAKKTAVKAGK